MKSTTTGPTIYTCPKCRNSVFALLSDERFSSHAICHDCLERARISDAVLLDLQERLDHLPYDTAGDCFPFLDRIDQRQVFFFPLADDGWWEPRVRIDQQVPKTYSVFVDDRPAVLCDVEWHLVSGPTLTADGWKCVYSCK